MSLLRRLRALVARRKDARPLSSDGPDPPAAPSVPRPAAHVAAHAAAPDLQDLEAQARYHRDRLALYRARVLSAKPTSPARLRELERASAAADARLRRAARPDRPASKDR